MLNLVIQWDPVNLSVTAEGAVGAKAYRGDKAEVLGSAVWDRDTQNWILISPHHDPMRRDSGGENGTSGLSLVRK